MYLHKSTRYALHAALELALSGERQTTAREVAVRYELPENVVAKVLQQLAHAGVATGARGVGGGYRLARPPEEISVQALIDIFEPASPPDSCMLRDPQDEQCAESSARACRLMELFQEVDETVRSTFASVSLATLAVRTPPRPEPRPAARSRT